jgi:hypothetical protein
MIEPPAHLISSVGRRIEITLDGEPPREGWCAGCSPTPRSTPSLRAAPGHSVRQALADVRDAFDHIDVLPERIDRQQIVDAMG